MMKKILDVVVSDVTTEGLCEWLSKTLNTEYPGRVRLPDGKLFSAWAEYVPPKKVDEFHQVVIRGRLKDLESERESEMDTLAWYTIQPLAESRQELTCVTYLYTDEIKGWLVVIEKRLRAMFKIEESKKDRKHQSRLDFYGFELILNTSVKRFEKWLVQYVPSSIPSSISRSGIPVIITEYPVTINEEENKYIKYLGSPYPNTDYGIETIYFIDVSVGNLENIEPSNETDVATPLLRIIEKDKEMTMVIIDLRNIDMYSYIKDLTQEIARLWPETKREIFKLEHGYLTWLNMDERVFEYILEAEPEGFMEWLHIEIAEMYRGPYSREYENGEILTHLTGDYLPPDNSTFIWEYVIFAHDEIFVKDKETGKIDRQSGFSGVIARIELRHIVNNRHHVRCLVSSDYLEIMPLLNALDEKVLRVYQPTESLKSDENSVADDKQSVLEKHREPPGFTTEQKELIDQACIGWARRGYQPKYNMDEYLNEFYNKHLIFLSKDQFKVALKDAGRRGLIVKSSRNRWTLP